MIKIDTGYDLVFRFDNVVDSEMCDSIYNYMISIKNLPENSDIEKMPWHEGDTLAYNLISDYNIKNKVKQCKEMVNSLISECFKTTTYCHFSDLVLWRKGRKMWWHKDTGYEWDKDVFKPRVFSSVCYLNDTYQGGETLIKQGEEIYVSHPKKGSVVCFTSDERCEHRVNEILDGTRLTLAMWFTTDKQHIERD